MMFFPMNINYKKWWHKAVVFTGNGGKKRWFYLKVVEQSATTLYFAGVLESSPNLCVNSSFSYVVLSTLLLSSKDLTEWSLVYHSTLSYQRFYDLHSIHYDHLEGLHQLI